MSSLVRCLITEFLKYKDSDSITRSFSESHFLDILAQNMSQKWVPVITRFANHKAPSIENNLMRKYHTLPDLNVQIKKFESHKLKKLQREDRFTWKINLEVVTYLLIKFLDLFTSELEYLGIKVSKKSGFILILWFFVDDTFSKIKRDGKLFRKRLQNFTSWTLSRWLYENITSSGLLINKKQKARDTKKEITIFKKIEQWNFRVLFFMSRQI